MMKKRACIIFLVAFMLIQLLSGCAGRSTDPKQPGAPAPAAPDTPAALPSDLPDDPPDDPAGDTTAPDDTWAHDYRPGMENTMSSYRPCYYTIENYSPVIRQDEMLYFVSGGILRKMPVGGSVVNVQGIYDFKDAFINPKEIQVVGDWIYVRYDYDTVIESQFRDYKQGVARISTDGCQTELVVSDMCANDDYSGGNPFVIRGDDIYYTYKNYTQISASQFEFTSGLKRVNMETGEETVLHEQAVGRHNYGMEIAAYTEDTILLRVQTSLSSGDRWLYDYETGALTEAPQIYCNGVDGNCYMYYSQSGDKNHVYRYAPETGYEEELCYSEEFTWSKDNPEWHSVLFADGIMYAATHRGIVAVKDGQRYYVTPDPAGNFNWIGDGYLYYSSGGSFNRILPDGTGWEPVDWYYQ